jgi:hypothetical protein
MKILVYFNVGAREHGSLKTLSHLTACVCVCVFVCVCVCVCVCVWKSSTVFIITHFYPCDNSDKLKFYNYESI